MGVTGYTADIALPSGLTFVTSSVDCTASGDPQTVECVRAAGVANGLHDTLSFDLQAASNTAGSTSLSPTLSNITPSSVNGTGTPGTKGDIVLKINLASDSDALAGHH